LRGGDTRDEVGGTGAGGGDAYAHLARGPRIAIRGVCGSLLVPHGHVMDGIRGELMIQGDDLAPRDAKCDVNALSDETFPDDLRSIHPHGIRSSAVVELVPAGPGLGLIQDRPGAGGGHQSRIACQVSPFDARPKRRDLRETLGDLLGREM